jgi:hexosaminidase
MHQIIKRTLMFAIVFIITNKVSAQQKFNIIPQPLKLTAQKGKFVLNVATKIYIAENSQQLKEIGLKLAKEIKDNTGLSLPVISVKLQSAQNLIVLSEKNKIDSLGKEGYQLTVSTNQITINGLPAGVFYGAQTLMQLLPPNLAVNEPIAIPAVSIIDKPRFEWRGMMLDVGRHFYPVAYIKRYLDYLAFHKLNTFHWHLVEDGGWRIEIKKYPLLTKIGAVRQGTQWGPTKTQFDPTVDVGFYTQEEIKEVVKYAADRYITVIPEIEMPGHTQSSLAAYPEYSCTGGPFEVMKYWARSYDLYCAGNDKTFTFLEDVLTEVAALFPSKYIHIGGDEAPKNKWKVCPKCQARIKSEGLKDEHELQTYFITRIEKFLLTKNKSIIGWDEILEGGLAPNAAVMSWRGIAGGIAAAKQKHTVVMTPTTYLYFDYPQGPTSLEGAFSHGPLLTLEKVYSYEPIPKELTADEAKYIKGVQGNVWSEFIHSPERAEYMSFPRGAALAEVAWSYPSQKNWESFKQRLETQYLRYDARNITYAKSALNVLTDIAIDTAAKTATIALKTQSYQPEIYYTLNGQEPDRYSPKYVKQLNLPLPVNLKAIAYKNGKRISLVTSTVVSLPTPK